MNTALRIEDYVGEPPQLDPIRLSSASASLAYIEEKVRELGGRLQDLRKSAEAVSPEAIEVAVSGMLDMERRHAEIVVPLIKGAESSIDAMLRSRTSHTAEQKSYMRLLDRYAAALASWLEALQDARIRLHLLASEKMRAAGAADIEITNENDLDKYFQSIAGR